MKEASLSSTITKICRPSCTLDHPQQYATVPATVLSMQQPTTTSSAHGHARAVTVPAAGSRNSGRRSHQQRTGARTAGPSSFSSSSPSLRQLRSNTIPTLPRPRGQTQLVATSPLPPGATAGTAVTMAPLWTTSASHPMHTSSASTSWSPRHSSQGYSINAQNGGCCSGTSSSALNTNTVSLDPWADAAASHELHAQGQGQGSNHLLSYYPLRRDPALYYCNTLLYDAAYQEETVSVA